MTTTAFKYSLDRSSKKVKCPQCGQKRAVRYKDNEAGEFLPDAVSRCDREHNCGYHLTPKQYFAENGEKQTPFVEKVAIESPKPIDYIPLDLLSKSVKHYDKNNLYRFLKTLFTETIAREVSSIYLIGSSSYWRGATAFWQIDETGHPRQCKIILYDHVTGKRVKEGTVVERYDRKQKLYVTETALDACSKIYGRYLSEETRTLNLEQTWFGHHLLTEYPDKEICITESEKTALICSVYMPEFIWLSTGGARGGCKWREYAVYKALKHRSITFYPDYGYADKKAGKTCYEDWSERVERIKDVLPVKKIRVSNVLEKRLAHLERKDQDLADLLLSKDEQTGIALTEDGYPVSWDYSTLS